MRVSFSTPERKSNGVCIRYSHRNYFYSLIELFASESNVFLASVATGLKDNIPLIDTTASPYDVKTISVADLRARGTLCKFRKQRLNAFLDEHESYSMAYSNPLRVEILVAGVFYYGADKVHVLAKVAASMEDLSRESALTVPFQVISAMIYYE